MPCNRYCHGTHDMDPKRSRYVDRIPCLSTFEKAYMKKYSAQLATGLNALRQPGCFPHGKLIISAGYYRTGSTLLFNMVRLWGVLGAEDNLLAGWGCHKKVPLFFSLLFFFFFFLPLVEERAVFVTAIAHLYKHVPPYRTESEPSALYSRAYHLCLCLCLYRQRTAHLLHGTLYDAVPFARIS